MGFVYEKVDGKPKQNVNGKHGPVNIHPDYEGQEHFWNTLDTRAVNWTYEWPTPVGIVLRIMLAIVLGTNRLQPYPTGNKDKVRNLWEGWPRPVRWFLWHLRNFMQDLRKYYLGFGHAYYEDRLRFAGYSIPKNSRPDSFWKHVRVGFFMPHVKWLPFPLAFPTLELRAWPDSAIPIRIVLGWKQRGLFSITIQRTD